jgi:hypothetical protein
MIQASQGFQLMHCYTSFYRHSINNDVDSFAKKKIRKFHCETSGATIWVPPMNSHQFTSGAQMLQSLFFITHCLWQ